MDNLFMFAISRKSASASASVNSVGSLRAMRIEPMENKIVLMMSTHL